MKVEVLTVRGCPHAAVAVARAREAVARLGGGATVASRLVDDPDEARAVGMHGSPTVLLDGVDPFAPAELAGSLSCRLDGAPSIDALMAALSQQSRVAGTTERTQGEGWHGE